ncbi:uncharacterized protein LOC132165108 [Corylus avellana]|uniref:uncharacterized protein LOC132165108 n=1 Tax=Corylus avellana TaxID=13451 RepID=UPI00286BAFE9|nr:uncharacterized protein LOC132165108 [Corylus avellana]
MTCYEYLRAAKVWVDQLAAVGHPIDDEDLISFIIGDLNAIYNSFITSYIFVTRENSLSFKDFQNELLNHEMLLNQQHAVTLNSSTFALFTQRPGAKQYQFNSKGKMPQQVKYPLMRSRMPLNSNAARGPNFFSSESSNNASGGSHFNTADASNSSKSPRALCQICGNTSHQALDCVHRMDFSYQGRHPPPQLAAMVAQTNAAINDQEWFADSGANANITNNLENLNIQQPFEANETVEVGNGSGLTINNDGSALLHTPKSHFHLNKFFTVQMHLQI